MEVPGLGIEPELQWLRSNLHHSSDHAEPPGNSVFPLFVKKIVLLFDHVCARFLLNTFFLILLKIIWHGVELLGHVVVLCLTSEELPSTLILFILHLQNVEARQCIGYKRSFHQAYC